MINPETQFQHECQLLAARVALTAAESMPLSKRVMISRGVLPLLPVGSDLRQTAETVSSSLEAADQAQLHLFDLIDAQ